MTQPPSPTTFQLKIDNKDIKTTVISDESHLSASLTDLLSSIALGRIKRIVGLDIQTAYFPSNTASPEPSLLSEKVAILKLSVGRVCLLIQLFHFRSIPPPLAYFFNLPDLTFTGVGIQRCFAALERDYGLGCRHAVDLSELAAMVKQKPYMKAFGLADLATDAGLVNVNVRTATLAFSDWAAVTLSLDQIRSATMDAFLSFYIGNQLLGGLNI